MLHSNTQLTTKKRFKFEAIWPRFPGYLQAVQEGWVYSLQNVDIFRTLDYKFRNTATVLKRWSQEHIGSIRLQLAIAKEVVFRLDKPQETR